MWKVYVQYKKDVEAKRGMDWEKSCEFLAFMTMNTTTMTITTMTFFFSIILSSAVLRYLFLYKNTKKKKKKSGFAYTKFKRAAYFCCFTSIRKKNISFFSLIFFLHIFLLIYCFLILYNFQLAAAEATYL